MHSIHWRYRKKKTLLRDNSRTPTTWYASRYITNAHSASTGISRRERAIVVYLYIISSGPDSRLAGHRRTSKYFRTYLYIHTLIVVVHIVYAFKRLYVILSVYYTLLQIKKKLCYASCTLTLTPLRFTTNLCIKTNCNTKFY